MIELFKNVVIMSIIGSLLTLLLVVIRPITEKNFLLNGTMKLRS